MLVYFTAKSSTQRMNDIWRCLCDHKPGAKGDDVKWLAIKGFLDLNELTYLIVVTHT